ncbi:nitrogen fixation protein NifX [Chrysiogenes arsenatis]|uniref:nitrogen fixation protein NifX n=1 Tax=Chrysiogenes arsenatis TaxID=309797 RepID=UPI000417F00F|nr:nitrogen fixation protein NifX [Chrysiogenes arsenatis]
MKVAFCTQDGTLVDEHFGQAERIDVYDVDDTGFSFVESRTFAPRTADGDHRESTENRASAISDCAIIYVIAIGGPAAAVVVRHRVHPVKVSEPQSIQNLLAALQKTLAGSPPPWLRKAMLASASA